MAKNYNEAQQEANRKKPSTRLRDKCGWLGSNASTIQNVNHLADSKLHANNVTLSRSYLDCTLV
eukprot:2582410-Amphidinium_carterae.1